MENLGLASDSPRSLYSDYPAPAAQLSPLLFGPFIKHTHTLAFTQSARVGRWRSAGKQAMNINNSIIPNLYLIENSSLFNNSRLMDLRSNQIGSISDI